MNAEDIAERFAPFAAKMRAENLPSIVVDNFRHYYAQLLAGDTGLIPETDLRPIDRVPEIGELERYADAGLRAVPRAAVLKLNGGLGTSMGLERAKSLLVARDDLTFLDIIARQVLRASSVYGCSIPLLLMNSFSTDDDTREVLGRYPDLRGDIPVTLMQHKVPKVLRDSLEPADWPADPELEWCPPGHGEVYIALAISGVLDTLLAHGYEYLFMSNADNLGATLDPRVLGYLVERRVPFLMEVAHRTEADKKGGHLAQLRSGQLILREIAQCPDDDLAAFQDIERHGYFNTNNIWVNLPELKRVLDAHGNVLQLPMIRNAKTLDPKDADSPPVYQLETAMGAAIAVFGGAEALCVTRERFMPVKLCSDLLVLRSDLYTMDEDYLLRPNPLRRLGPIAVDLDPAFYRLVDDFEPRFPDGPPSLVDCARLKVRGDVLFERGIRIAGSVEIANRAETQRRLPAGAELTESSVELT